MFNRVSGSRFGSNAVSANIFDCGKLNPSGSRHGPCTSSDKVSVATYTSIKLTKISLAWKCVFSHAGIAAQAMPPSAPAMIIAGNTSAPPLS